MTLHEKLEEIFREVFNDDTLGLTRETTGYDIPGWDSVAHINLMFAIEQAFGVQFSGNELAEMKNVGMLEDFLARKVRGVNSGHSQPMRG